MAKNRQGATSWLQRGGALILDAAVALEELKGKKTKVPAGPPPRTQRAINLSGLGVDQENDPEPRSAADVSPEEMVSAMAQKGH